METMGFVLVCILLFFLRPLLEELWTVLQIVKSIFPPRKDLKKCYGSWAVITGCTDGIGRSFSFELARRGLNVVLISRNPEKLEQLSCEIRTACSVETKVIVADFAKGREIYQKIKEELEDVDIGILVNNVGVQYSCPMHFGELPEDELWGLLNINLGSVTQMTRIVLPDMVQKNRGAIVNLSSGSKLQPLPFMNLYAASKIFVDYHTDALRHEYRKTNLTIQSLCPYYVKTKINHFSSVLTRANIFIPTADAYVKHAVNTLGVINNTTGYWPHRFQYLLLMLTPSWIKTYVGGILYKSMRDNYLQSQRKIYNSS